MPQIMQNMNLFHFSEEVFNSLPQNERRLISPRTGTFIDSPNLVSRIIDFDQHFRCTAFVEAYKYNNSNHVAFITIAVKVEFRQRGVAQSLIKQVENDLLRKGFNKIIYRVFKSNIPSIRLAQRCKYKKVSTNKDFLIFVKDLTKSE